MKHISKKRQPVDGLLMILIFSLVFSGLFQVVLAFSNQGVADVMTFNYVWATTPIDNIFHLYRNNYLHVVPSACIWTEAF